MTGIPLNGRSYIDLLGLQAGVIPVSSGASDHDRFVSGNQNTGQVSVNGQRETSNSFMVNGGDVEESVQNGASIVPLFSTPSKAPAADQLVQCRIWPLLRRDCERRHQERHEPDSRVCLRISSQ